MAIEVMGVNALSYVMLDSVDITAGEVGMSCEDLTLDAGGGFNPVIYERTSTYGVPLVDAKGKPVGYRSSRWCYETEREIELNPNVSSRHGNTPYMVVANIIESLFPMQTISATMIEEGKKMMWIVKTDKSHTFDDGDRFDRYLMVTSSLDSTWKTAIRGYIHRPQCSNQFPFGNTVFESKNTTNNGVRFASWAAREKQRMFEHDWDEFIARASQLKHIPVPKYQTWMTLCRIIPEPKRRHDQSDQGWNAQYTRWQNTIDKIVAHFEQEERAYGRNMWALVQAIQSYELHDKSRNKDADGRLVHMHGVVAGNRQPLTDKALHRLAAV
jgi:hypothetical protein